MLNKTFEMVEQVLESIDIGGEQSRQFAPEIQLLKDILGYPQLTGDVFEEVQQRDLLAERLRRIAIEAEGLKASLPTIPLEKWFDGTIEDATIDVFFEEYDLAELLRFVADVGVSHSV